MQHISGVSELNEFIVSNMEEGNVIMIYFGAEWCGPCKQLKKRLDDSETQQQLRNLAVGYLDVEDRNNTTLVEKRYKVSVLPTQIFITVEDNKVIEINRIEGYNFDRLEAEYHKILSN